MNKAIKNCILSAHPAGRASEMKELIQTNNGHRRRINDHSVFFAGGPVPLFRLVCSVL
jgi:hypothetical protein